jgi:ankyrin repeat protein
MYLRFLLARLHMEKITNLHTRGHINLALHNLAKETDGLDETYKQAMDRIENQGDELRALAKQILAWIIHAKRPLSITELRHAVAVRPNAVKVDIEFLPSDQTLRSVCEGLVTVDEKSNIVRLVHYTTEEFFKRTWQSWFHSAQTDIANVCIGYLSFHTFETGYCETDEEFKSRLQENSLYAYSSQNWGYHVSGTAMERESLVLDLLMSKNKLDSSTQAMLAPTYGSQDSFYEQTVPRQMTAVHVAAYFGLVGALIELFKVGHEPDSRDTYQRTPLSWAAKNCHKPAVELLLATAGVNVNSQDQNGQTPLMEAAFQGDGTVVELLLGAEGIEVNSKDNDGLTPLLVATRDGHKGVVKLLLGKGANPESKDKYGQTPLYIAAVRGHEGVVKLLLEEGADPESKDEYGQTPLLAAIIQGNVAVVELLLGTEGVDMNSRDNIGLTPLRAATMKGDERVVRLLFEKWLYPD